MSPYPLVLLLHLLLFGGEVSDKLQIWKSGSSCIGLLQVGRVELRSSLVKSLHLRAQPTSVARR